MRLALKIVSVLSLIGLVLPSVLFLAGRMELDEVKWYMVLATIVWFVSATPVMWKDNGQAQQDDAAAA